MLDNTHGKYLFHGTGIYCLASIIRENRLDEGVHWGKPGEPHGPRLTESYETAVGFITYNAYYAEGGVLVLDRALLEKDYRLQAYEDKAYDGGEWGNESEVVAITPAIENLDRYLVAIMFDPAFVAPATEEEFLSIAWSEGGWPYPCDDEGADRMREDLKSLASHALLNATGSAEDIPRHGNIPIPASAQFA